MCQLLRLKFLFPFFFLASQLEKMAAGKPDPAWLDKFEIIEQRADVLSKGELNSAP